MRRNHARAVDGRIIFISTCSNGRRGLCGAWGGRAMTHTRGLAVGGAGGRPDAPALQRDRLAIADDRRHVGRRRVVPADHRPARAAGRIRAGYTSVHRYDAELGWLPIRIRPGRFVGSRTISVRHNSLGLRGEHERSKRPTILFVGDSFVWGYDVEASERFTELLRADLPGVEIVSITGVNGYEVPTRNTCSSTASGARCSPTWWC